MIIVYVNTLGVFKYLINLVVVFSVFAIPT